MPAIRRKTITRILTYLILTLIGAVIIYPFLWLVGAAFHDTYALVVNPSIIPKEPSLNGFINGWKGAGMYDFGTYFFNTYRYVLLKVAFTFISSLITAYGVARFEFPFKKPMFSILIATLLFPAVVVIVPLYILFS